MNLTQIIRRQSAVLSLSVRADGTLNDPGSATFTLKDLDGTTTDTLPVTDAGDGTYTVTVPAKDDLALLTATLAFGSDPVFDQGRIEIVGGVLFTENQARNFDSARLSSETKFTDADIAAERTRITDWLESMTGISWVPRYRRVKLRGTDSDRISLYNTVRSQGPSGGEGARNHISNILAATINDETVDPALVEVEGAALWLTSGFWTWARRPNVVIDYEYGLDHVQREVDRIALLELADRLPSSRRSRDATTATDDLGTATYWQPQNNGRPSRVPEVNAWLRDNDHRIATA